MNSKKAQSEVITTVLIILLVLAAIIIVWMVVQNTVTKGGEQISQGVNCIGVSMTVSPSSTSSVLAKSGNFTIKREAQGDTFTNTSIVVLVNGVTAPSTEYSTNTIAGDVFKSPLVTQTLTVTNLSGTVADLTKVEVALKVDGNVCGSEGIWTKA